MGPFYTELQIEASKVLKNYTQSDLRPLGPKISFFIDVVLGLIISIYSYYYMSSDGLSPLWQLVLLNYIADMVCYRLSGQAHAIGHLQVCDV
jgi:hypothetical protein